ncbi:MAG: hypothetical protein HGA19_07095 [Oscillochloris sp.]|nr:hypothetical protein [Oscillochloris sp.]
MRTIGRTLVIVLAALLVAGATYALGNNGLLGSAGDRSHGGEVVSEGGAPTGSFAESGERHGRGEHSEGGGDHEEGGIGSAVEILKNLVIISLIVALVSGSSALLRRFWPKIGSKKPPTEITAG